MIILMVKCMIMKEDLLAAHRFCTNNKPALLKDKVCGCFYCLKIYSPDEIREYIAGDNDCDRQGTALCPYCGVDSVIGESAGFPLTDEFLRQMKEYWFDSKQS